MTHNFMAFESGFDHYEVARGLDFASWASVRVAALARKRARQAG
ncbi:hypothetical protein [Deinococcus reticulitermitis]|nr:hypothetical protein [Deinococcus reticulitermitis]